MKKLNKLMQNPSGFDSLNNYCGEIPEDKWLVVLTRSRDSNCLTESNWETALSELGGESDTVEIHRFGHWACGWWEALCVAQGSKHETIGQDIVNRLDSYPVLDDDDLSEREILEANEVWANCYTWKERLDYIRDHSSQFDLKYISFKDLMAQVRGEYFGGYASELIY